MPPPRDADPHWQIQTLNERTGRIEEKLDRHIERIDDRFTQWTESTSAKLDEMRRELQLARLSNSELFASRRELDGLRSEVNDINRTRQDHTSRVNLALIGSFLSIAGGVIIRFLPVGAPH